RVRGESSECSSARKPPSATRVPSTLAGRVPPDVARVATCPECPSRETPPGYFSSAPRVPRVHIEKSPRALGEHATCPRECFLFPPNFKKNTRKCLKLCKIIEIRVLVRKIPN